MCGSMSLFCFCDSQGSPRIKSESSFSLVPSFHTLVPPLFLYTHSSSPPSLLARHWMALSLWWVTDEWSSSLKSRVTARLVKHEEMPDKRRPGEKGRRKEGRKRKKKWTGGGLHSTRENVKQRTSIKSVRDRARMCVAERESVRESVRCIFAWVPWSICIVVLNMQKARITQVGNNPSRDKVTSFWNRPSGLNKLPGGLWVFMGLKCAKSLFFFYCYGPTETTLLLG